MSLKWVAVEVIEVFQDRGTISSESRSRLLSHITSATENCVGMYPEVVAIEQLLGYSPSTSPRDGTQATAVVARELIAMGVLSHVLFQGSLSSEEMKHRNIEAPLNLHNAAHVRIEFVCTPQSRK